MAEHNELGTWGEELAAVYLQSKGLVILDRDWHQGCRDLDIIALADEGSTLVFVEVKARRDELYRYPEEAVDDKKIRNLAYAANAYLKGCRLNVRQIRFDIVSVIGTEPRTARIDHIEDAFNPLLTLGKRRR